MARRAADFGVLVDGPVRADMARVKARKDTISGQSRSGLEEQGQLQRVGVKEAPADHGEAERLIEARFNPNQRGDVNVKKSKTNPNEFVAKVDPNAKHGEFQGKFVPAPSNPKSLVSTPCR